MSQDLFKEKAKTWDKGLDRVNGAQTISNAIQDAFTLTPDMKLMDFGVGTGLLGFDIARHVQEVVGIDTSAKMLEKLKEKNTNSLSIKGLNIDIVSNPLNETFDGIISSMTLHHVEDLQKFFTTIYNNVKENGFIAIADLESEDGTFHSDNTGVFHFGFDEKELCKVVKDSGFKEVSFKNINTINKPHRDFGVFLLTAKK